MLYIMNKKNYQNSILLFFLIVMQGCAVLTDSQVTAVRGFAKAAEDYNDLPGSVIKLHADSMLIENIYSAATAAPEKPSKLYPDPNIHITDKINGYTDGYLKLFEEADKADAALNVIGTYRKLLLKLTSNDFTEQLQEEASSLGAEVDGAIDQYNKTAKTKISSFGAIVAMAVRAGGGIIIRHKQAEAVKEAVNRAEPVIGKMSGEVIGLMDSYIGEVDKKSDQGNGYANQTAQGLLNEYKLLLNSKSKNTINDVQDVTQSLLKAKSIKPLAEKTKKAMETFRAAHTKLHEELKERKEIEESIEEIKILFGEIKAAQRLKKEIEGK